MSLCFLFCVKCLHFLHFSPSFQGFYHSKPFTSVQIKLPLSDGLKLYSWCFTGKQYPLTPVNSTYQYCVWKLNLREVSPNYTLEIYDKKTQKSKQTNASPQQSEMKREGDPVSFWFKVWFFPILVNGSFAIGLNVPKASTVKGLQQRKADCLWAALLRF